MPYIWVDEIEDAYEVLPGEEVAEICYEIAKKEVLAEGEYSEDDPEFEDVVLEESDYIGVYRIRTSSALYNLLCEWYEQQGRDITQEVRGYYEDYYGDYMYYVTGCGYDILSADLLGGSANGEARREFDAFVRERF